MVSSNEKLKKMIFDFVGIIDDEEADLMEKAINESRKIDTNEW